MSNQLLTLLKKWLDRRNDTEWVLGTLIEAQGSSYRKPGAMMLFNGLGQHFGLLSGGCLEADLRQHAHQVMTSKKIKTVTYDMHDKEDITWQLGIGCGDTICIQLSPITPHNDYLQLEQVYEQLKQRMPAWYILPLENDSAPASVIPETHQQSSTFAGNLPVFEACKHASRITQGDQAFLAVPLRPAPHLVIFGGGIDAQPVVTFAHELGWQITLVDHRTSYARPGYFPNVTRILHCQASTLTRFTSLTDIDAAIIMTHNIKMDADALTTLSQSTARYIALLGAFSRREKVFSQTPISEKDLPVKLSTPAGLDIGGELPESIALAMLAECHTVLEKRSGLPLRQVYQ